MDLKCEVCGKSEHELSFSEYRRIMQYIGKKIGASEYLVYVGKVCDECRAEVDIFLCGRLGLPYEGGEG